MKGVAAEHSVEPSEIPNELCHAASVLLTDAETLLALECSELDHTGVFTPSALVLTDRRLIVCRRDGPTWMPVASVALTELREVRHKELQGVSVLEGHTETKAVALGCFTRTHARGAARIAALSNARLTHTQPLVNGDNGKNEIAGRGWNAQQTKICASCGKPIPHRIGVCPDCIDRRRLLVRLLGRVRPYLLPISAGLLLMLLLTGVEMAQPLLTKILVDDVIPKGNLPLFAWIVAGIIAIYVFSSLFAGVRSYILAWLGEQIVHDLRREVYAHLQTLSLEFYDQRETGWIMDRVSSDTSNLQNFMAEGFQDFVRDLMTLVVILGIMVWMNWSLTLITLLPSPLVLWLTRRFMHRVHRMYHGVWRRRAYMAALLTSVIPGVRVVKVFAQEARETRRFSERSRHFMEAGVKTARSFATFYPMIQFATSLGFVMVWTYGGYQVISGRGVTLGTLIAFISYLWRFYAPVNNLSRFSHRMERAFTSAQRVFDVLDTEAQVVDPPHGRALPALQGRVEFKNVTFGYDPDLPVLHDVSFHAEPGEMIGLVGPSGAGKSTTINLLCRFYDVHGGSIMLDGHDIRDVTVNSLHMQIGVVLQDPFLFHGTIADNIAYGNPDAGHRAIIEAAKAANAHEFIMQFPDAYDTMVGERGQRLSGGERQRISIARAILKNPRILILDEATSSVDAETEEAIQHAIERLIQGRTTLAIAHRFSTLRNADRLVVLDQGRVVEIGTHAELLAREDGLFRRLCDLQRRTSEIVAVGG